MFLNAPFFIWDLSKEIAASSFSTQISIASRKRSDLFIFLDRTMKHCHGTHWSLMGRETEATQRQEFP